MGNKKNIIKILTILFINEGNCKKYFNAVLENCKLKHNFNALEYKSKCLNKDFFSILNKSKKYS